MSKIALVTDSTTYMPPELVKKYNISVAPQILIWGDQTYKDGVDIQPSEFYAKLKTAREMPTTSQVSVASFQEIFQKLVEQDFEVLALLISTKLSGTIQSAVQAQELIGSAGGKIHIVDSHSVAMALGFQVLAVARALEQGASLREAIALAEKSSEYTGVFFAVDTLEFLHRGGRIGGAQRFIGTMLNMKPILAIQEGRVEGIERIRTKVKAHERILELTVEKIRGRSPVHIATLHANAAEDAEVVLTKAEQALHPVESVFSEVSPVVGTHAGPGTVGLAFMAGI
ncbi:MAG: DegV family protein [Anaerolineales bacterium]|nr:DegV family protein [Anaerolineales bacterium]